MVKKLKVGLIFGGRSGEHEVSLRSAGSVIEALDAEKYEIVPLAITKEGRWLSPAASVGLLPENIRGRIPLKVSDASVALLGDPSRNGIYSLNSEEGAERDERLDVVFPVLHGTYGEDGTIQGLLEMAGLPYVGCGVLASSCGMDKVMMKALFREAQLPICKYVWFTRSEWERNGEVVRERVAADLGFPCFVKPANLGSSVGISRADDLDTLTNSVDLAARYDRKIIVEEALEAREIECGVIGNDEPEASLPGEYVVHDERARFLDYTEKYSNTGHVEFVVPAPLPEALAERVRELAVKAFAAVDGAGFARVDFFLTRESGELYINELNTIPGLTDVSGFPKMWEASGVTFKATLEWLIELAFERYKDKSRNLTSI